MGEYQKKNIYIVPGRGGVPSGKKKLTNFFWGGVQSKKSNDFKKKI